MDNIPISELVSKALINLKENGLSKATVKFYKEEIFKPIQQFYTRNKATKYCAQITDEYISFSLKRLEDKKIGVKRFRALELGANRLKELSQTGKISLNPKKRGPAIQITQTYEELLHNYTQTLKCHQSTLKGHTAIIRRYFAFLQDINKQNITNVQLIDLKRFIIETTKWYGSKKQLISILRSFHKFAHEQNLITFKYENALYTPASPHKKVLPCFSQQELNYLFSSIDIETPDGKRDYAILRLAANTGLRTIDITNLKLSDINWKQREISITQRKTGHPLTLPIDNEIIHALEKYIQHSRPTSLQEYVFLRNHAPYQPFNDGHAIGSMFRRRMKKAGLPKENGDGRSVHALRRTIGTQMVKAEIPLTTISQILGHQTIDSTKRYLSLDCIHLKICALNLAGIAVTRKELV